MRPVEAGELAADINRSVALRGNGFDFIVRPASPRHEAGVHRAVRGQLGKIIVGKPVDVGELAANQDGTIRQHTQRVDAGIRAQTRVECRIQRTIRIQPRNSAETVAANVLKTAADINRGADCRCKGGVIIPVGS